LEPQRGSPQTAGGEPSQADAGEALGKTRSEDVVARLAGRTFLSLWSYANPLKMPGKELCDMLAVCGSDVVIFSVKEVAGEGSSERWYRRAIEASVKQIYGAERWLDRQAQVIRSCGRPGIALPNPANRRVHRVAVALGGQGGWPILGSDFGRGFVHVLTEESLYILLRELDTVRDFTKYLGEKEDRIRGGLTVILEGGERDLLALFLQWGHAFPPDAEGTVAVAPGHWDRLLGTAEYARRKEENQASYVWDQLIENVAAEALAGRLQIADGGLDDIEAALRLMAAETRFARRLLGKAFLSFYELALAGRVTSRSVVGESGTAYIFMVAREDDEREVSLGALIARCLVFRGLHPDRKRVVGIVMDRLTPGFFPGVGICLFEIDEWLPEHQQQFEYALNEVGVYRETVETRISEHEFPHELAPESSREGQDRGDHEREGE
jgi:hypothetical protein